MTSTLWCWDLNLGIRALDPTLSSEMGRSGERWSSVCCESLDESLGDLRMGQGRRPPWHPCEKMHGAWHTVGQAFALQHC